MKTTSFRTTGLLAWVILPTSSLAQDTYFPPVNSDDWRSLLAGPNVTPTESAKDNIRETVGLDWDQLRDAWNYSRQFDQGSAFIVIRDGWIAAEWGSTLNTSGVSSVSKSLTVGTGDAGRERCVDVAAALHAMNGGLGTRGLPARPKSGVRISRRVPESGQGMAIVVTDQR